METLLPLLGFVVAGTVTPGPNNLMVLASGANFGVSRTIPHIVGIAIGFPVMIVAIGLGLAAVFEAAPWLEMVLRYVAFAYLCWLAWQIAEAGRPDTSKRAVKPLTLLQAALFQWVNPKGWAMMLGGVALFVDPQNRVVGVALMALLFGLACLPNGVAWAMFGRAIAGFLDDDRRRRWFNWSMAILLVASGLPALWGHH